MAGNESGDLLMMVLATPGNPILGESESQLTPKSPLLKGFREKMMFEISDFQFGVQTLKDASKSGLDGKSHTEVLAGIIKHPALTGNPLVAAAVEAANAAINAAHRQAQQAPPNSPLGQPKACPVEPITFRRPIDAASNKLMQYCIDCTTLHGAVVVKRKPAGGAAAGEVYLRLEFIDVLFTDMAWSNGEPVEERCTFITRAVNVLYRPQLPNGTLGAVKSGFWSRKADATGEELTY